LKGFVPTPDRVVDVMVAKLFENRPPSPESVVLDPGCGSGAFIQGIIRWARERGAPVPRVVGIESDLRHIPEALESVWGFGSISILNEDFLDPRTELFDYIIGNPPYVPITGLTIAEREKYRKRYATATGRFDLYLLFYEQALRLMKPGARLVFITPEKFLYVRTAEPLRRALARLSVEEVHLVDEATFGDLVTYPTITTVVNTRALAFTRVILRNGERRKARLPADGTSWLPSIHGGSVSTAGATLVDVCRRVSCGVATGADAVFVVRLDQVPPGLRRFAHPTIAGRQIRGEEPLRVSHAMIIPYGQDGALLAEQELGDLGAYLKARERRVTLERRTCVARKLWYAFHENPPLPDILRPKILCKDITARPFFVPDERGDIVPRHSVYYIVPTDPAQLHRLCDYLNSPAATAWLEAHCQRAANGFLRLQSHVLKHMPVPHDLADERQERLFAGAGANG
jgi:adenine-specific DNA-methyltransferase